jgi:predicted component of type VI protein secretion system
MATLDDLETRIAAARAASQAEVLAMIDSGDPKEILDEDRRGAQFAAVS